MSAGRTLVAIHPGFYRGDYIAAQQRFVFFGATNPKWATEPEKATPPKEPVMGDTKPVAARKAVAAKATGTVRNATGAADVV